MYTCLLYTSRPKTPRVPWMNSGESPSDDSRAISYAGVFHRCYDNKNLFYWVAIVTRSNSCLRPKGPPRGSYRKKNTCPMLVLPLRKIFVPSLVEVGPVAVSYTHLDVYKRQTLMEFICIIFVSSIYRSWLWQ